MALESHVSSHNFQQRSYAMLKSFIGSGLGLLFVFQTEAELLKCTSKLKTMFHFQLIFLESVTKARGRISGFELFCSFDQLKKNLGFSSSFVD